MTDPDTELYFEQIEEKAHELRQMISGRGRNPAADLLVRAAVQHVRDTTPGDRRIQNLSNNE